VPHKLQEAFCFMLIHVQLHLPASQATSTTKTSYGLFNKLALQCFWL